MNTGVALEQLNISAEDLTAEMRQELDERGYFVLNSFFSEEECAEMAAEVDRIAESEQFGGGGEVSVEAGATRVSNIFNKSEVFDRLLAIKPVLAASHYLLGEFKIHGANVREPHQGTGRQPLHSDSIKLGDGKWCLVNALIAFDPLTLENGSTRIVPCSHLWGALNVPGENALYATEKKEPHRWAEEGENVAEHSASSPVTAGRDKSPSDPFAPYPGELTVVVPAGSVVFCNAHLWHSGTTKKNNDRRRLLALSYTRRDLPQQLIQRDYITPRLYDRISEAQRYILDLA